MKNIILILSVIFLLSIYKVDAVSENDNYKEKVYEIKFNNLNSKDINKLLEGTSSLIVEIDTNIGGKVTTYRFNSIHYKDIERELINKVLKSISDRELKTYIELNGVKITRISLRCIKEHYNLIIDRKANLYD